MSVAARIIGVWCSKSLTRDAELFVREKEGSFRQHTLLESPGAGIPCRCGHFVFDYSGDGEQLPAVDGLLELHLAGTGNSAQTGVGVLAREGDKGYGGALVDEVHHGELLGLLGLFFIRQCFPGFLVDAEGVDLE